MLLYAHAASEQPTRFELEHTRMHKTPKSFGFPHNEEHIHVCSFAEKTREMLQFILPCIPCLGPLTPVLLQDTNETHIRSYALEKIPDFRLVSRLLGRRSHTVLTHAHIVPAHSQIAREVEEIGQFAEVSLGLYDCMWIWGVFEHDRAREKRRMEWLVGKGGPLEGYEALRDSELLEVVRGDVADYQVILSRRNLKFSGDDRMNGEEEDKEEKAGTDDGGEAKGKARRLTQICVAFSGTANLQQGLLDLYAFQTHYQPIIPHAGSTKRKQCGKGKDACSGLQHDARVHAGFWKLYTGVRHKILHALTRHAIQNEDAGSSTSKDAGSSSSAEDEIEVVATGHSLGAALATFFMTDLLSLSQTNIDAKPGDGDETGARLQALSDRLKGTGPGPRLRLKLVLLGSPRVGNEAFAKLYGSLVTRFRESRKAEGRTYSEYSVRAHNDGTISSKTLISNRS